MVSPSFYIMEFHVSYTVAYIAETLIIWDYLISIYDENRYLGIFLQIWDMFSGVFVRVWWRLNICWVLSKLALDISFHMIRSPGDLDMDCFNPSLIILESIMVIHAWEIMGRQCHILWTFLGLLTLSTIASLLLYLLPIEPADGIYYLYFISCDHVFAQFEDTGIIVFRHIAARAKANHVSDVRRFDFVLCDSVPLSISVASITTTRLLLRLRKQALSDSAGQPSASVQEVLLTFKPVSLSNALYATSELILAAFAVRLERVAVTTTRPTMTQPPQLGTQTSMVQLLVLQATRPCKIVRQNGVRVGDNCECGCWMLDGEELTRRGSLVEYIEMGQACCSTETRTSFWHIVSGITERWPLLANITIKPYAVVSGCQFASIAMVALSAMFLSAGKVNGAVLIADNASKYYQYIAEICTHFDRPSRWSGTLMRLQAASRRP
ncbi:hypothetical protein IW262DRAFT_1485094 [Armillaria fumosa]|nr:hypothetical protein IW262DRAFT_1485094 [Armillaria fumosa]